MGLQCMWYLQPCVIYYCVNTMCFLSSVSSMNFFRDLHSPVVDKMYNVMQIIYNVIYENFLLYTIQLWQITVIQSCCPPVRYGCTSMWEFRAPVAGGSCGTDPQTMQEQSRPWITGSPYNNLNTWTGQLSHWGSSPWHTSYRPNHLQAIILRLQDPQHHLIYLSHGLAVRWPWWACPNPILMALPFQTAFFKENHRERAAISFVQGHWCGLCYHPSTD